MRILPYCQENQEVSNRSSYGDKDVKNHQNDQDLWVDNQGFCWYSVTVQFLGRVHSVVEIHHVEIAKPWRSEINYIRCDFLPLFVQLVTVEG